MKRKNHSPAPRTTIRCAIYTRKSTEEGLEQEFNSLDAQREAAELFIQSQQHEGWVLVPNRFDDGGFTGGNLERPALKRLMQEIEAGRVDCVVVYKVDRLSRSLLDFAKIMGTFDQHQVSFVSVTQQFNTTHSMGRLTLNILLSFAQFEREIISERTRDKIAATRRKGKWSGGMPLLGYDLTANSKLTVNADEAVQVRAIFQLYLQERTLLATTRILNQRGWHCKRWQTRKGNWRGGHSFSKTRLHHLLTNITYLGRVKYKNEDHPGEHPAIIDPQTWTAVQSLLRRNGRSGGREVRNRFGFTLKGLLYCASCQCAMSPSHSLQKSGKRYRYYVCQKATKQGWDRCPNPSLPAGAIEEFIAQQIRELGHDPQLHHQTIQQVRQAERERLEGIDLELRQIERDLARWDSEMRALLMQPLPVSGNLQTGQLAELHETMRVSQQRRAELIQTKLDALPSLSEQQIREALQQFDLLWKSLSAKEQGRILQLLIERIEYSGQDEKIDLLFRPTGITSFLEETQRK